MQNRRNWSSQFNGGLLAPAIDWDTPTPEEKREALNMGLLSAGLGILANNTGHYGAFAPAVGKGLLGGLDTYQGLLSQGTARRRKYPVPRITLPRQGARQAHRPTAFRKPYAKSSLADIMGANQLPVRKRSRS